MVDGATRRRKPQGVQQTMKFPGKTRILALGLAGVLALGAIGAVVAEESTGGGVSSAVASALGHDGGKHHRAARITFRELVRASGLEPSVFVEGGAQGQTIEQVLVANNLDPQAVQDQMLADLNAKLAELVGSGTIDQPRADEIAAKAAEKLPEFMQVVPHRPDGADGHPFLRARFAHGLIESAATTIGITSRDLVSALRADDTATIASVATTHNVDPQTVIDNAIAAADARIDQAEANGNLDSDHAANAKERAAEAIARIVNEGRPHHD